MGTRSGRDASPPGGEEMIIEQVYILATQEQREKIASALASVVDQTQVQPGCMSCRVLQNWQDLEEFLIEVEWNSMDGLINHLRSETYTRLLLLIELSTCPPTLQFYTVQEVRGLDLVQQARLYH
jgi:quinol monooxygenase YgiN